MNNPAISRRALLVAASLGVGTASPALRAQQGPERRPTDWLDLIRRQHDGIASAFDALLDPGAQDWVRRFRNVALLLDAHQQGEENVVYPALARVGLRAPADKLYGEENDVKILKAKLVLLSYEQPRGNEWQPIARDLQRRVLEHAREHEEKNVLPELHRRLDDEQNVLVSTLFSVAFNSIEPTMPGRPLTSLPR